MGGFRFGITIARANCRAVAPTTEAMSSPSRRCACQSSGRVIEIVSDIASIIDLLLVLQRERHCVQGVALGAGELRGEGDGLLERQLGEQRFENSGVGALL